MHRTPFATIVGTTIALASLTFLACKEKTDTSPAPTTSSAPATSLASAAPASSGPVHSIPIPSASVLATVNPENLPAYDGPTGSVEGTIYVSGDPSPPVMGKSYEKCPAAAATYDRMFREGAPRPDGTRPLADAIVAVTGYSGYYIPERREAVTLAIKDCAYEARTVALTFGQRLEVRNLDMAKPPRMYAPHFANWPDPALMLAPPGGDPVKLYPKAPGRFRLVDLGGFDYLEAEVYVLGQPLHDVSNALGHYRIDGVPVGTKLKVNAMHPAIAGEVSKDFEARANVVERIDLVLPFTKPAPPAKWDGGTRRPLP
jgi:hypothetical protein